MHSITFNELENTIKDLQESLNINKEMLQSILRTEINMLGSYYLFIN